MRSNRENDAPVKSPHQHRNGFIAELRRLHDDERFRAGLLIFDLTTIVIFVVLTFMPPARWMIAVDAVIGTLILLELISRGLVADRRLKFLRQPSTLLDLLIVASLFVPTLTGSFAFLRVLRAIRLVRALRVLRSAKRRHRWLAEKGELIGSAANLVIFVFVTSAVVYEAQVDRNPDINTFSDALYFTVTTLTTTGFGDITLTGDSGRLLSVAIMIVGISLFVKLAQSIIRPTKVHFPCPHCGLSRHDLDAVHCKHCGIVLNIPNEGE